MKYDWKEAGYDAAKRGEKCIAPAIREIDRAAWEQGWRAGNNEMSKPKKVIDPVENIRTIIEDARKKEPTRHTYSALHKALIELGLEDEQRVAIESDLGYRGKDKHLKTEFMNLKFARRTARLKGLPPVE